MRWFVVSLDCDGDGADDVVATSPASHPYFGSKLGCYSAGGRHLRDLDVSQDPVSADAVDLDGDGRTDIVLGYTEGLKGPFVLAVWNTEGKTLGQLRLEDPGHSRLAAVVGARLGGSASRQALVALADGWIVGFSSTGEQWGQQILAGGAARLAAADLDGDGRDELITEADGLLSAWSWEGVGAANASTLGAPESCDLGFQTLEEGLTAPGLYGRLTRARAYFKHSIASDPDLARAYAGLAAAEAATSGGDKGALARARQWLAQGRAKGGSGPTFDRAEALLKHHEGDDAAASTILERVTREAPDVLGHWLDLARYQALQYRLDKALAALDQALPRAGSPEEAFRVHMRRGQIYEQVEQWPEAAQAHRRAASAQPESGAAWARLAVDEVESNHCAQARTAALRALELGQSWVGGWAGIRAEVCQGQLQEAGPFVKDASPSGLVIVGDFFRDRGDYEKAASYYDRVPKDAAEPELGLARAELALRGGDLPGARALIAPLAAKRPEEASVLAEQARIELSAGDKARALDLATQALEVDGRPPMQKRLHTTFRDDGDYHVRSEKARKRADALFGYFEAKYEYQRLRRDKVTTLWILGTVGARHKDRDAVPYVLPYLSESPFAATRASAADALWYIGDRRAVPAMIEALEDPSLKVRGFAASGLGDLRDPAAVDPLLSLFAELEDNREETKARIADALGKLGDPRAIPALEESLRSLRDPAYVKWAQPALARLRRVR
jgi:tetratricopeptide (TPR) repeat protein